MKRSIMAPLILSAFLISACGSNENSSTEENKISGNEETDITEESAKSNENLFDASDIEEGYWIGQSGDTIQDEDMIISNPIDYDPSLSYTMNRTAYVTYMSGEEILQTILYDETPPITIRTNEDANNIRISFDQTKLDDFNIVAE